jgi:hypothetical protein
LEKNHDAKANIATAFRRILCRKPTTKEIELLEQYYNEQLAMFKSGKLDAAKTIRAGEYPAVKSLGKNELAALMKLINLVYNMEETIVKT